MTKAIFFYNGMQWVVFGVLFCVLAVWETHAPWFLSRERRFDRWARYGVLACLSHLLIRLVFPLLPVGIAVSASEHGMGLLTQVAWPDPVKIGCALLFLDFWVYWQHRMMHRLSWLWRLHEVHHVEKHLDVSTGLRFHPLEALFSVAFRGIGVIVIGASPLAVCLFETWLGAVLLLTHANIRWPSAHEKWIRKVIVTPSMHRIHHSDRLPETHSNYGFGLSVWDRLFGTYRAFPHFGEWDFALGVEAFRDPRYQTLSGLLGLPFRPRYLRAPAPKPLRLRL